MKKKELFKFKEINQFLIFHTEQYSYLFSPEERCIYRIKDENRLNSYISQNKKGEPPSFDIPSISLLESLYKTKMRELVLNITETCNLRCKYCVYGECYPTIKGYSNKHMKSEIAIKAIEYFLERARNEFISICFYGGEPTIRLSDIISLIDFVRNKNSKENIYFFIDTNATLLNEREIQELVKRDVFLQISLDGPPSIHDFNRVTQKGEGTFKKIYNTISYLYKNYPSYFKEKVYFQITLTPLIDVRKVYRFFNTKFFKDNTIHITFLHMEEENDYIERYGEEHKKIIFKESIKELREKFIEMLVKGYKPDQFLWELFGRRLADIHFLLKNKRISNKIPLNGTCIPGIRRLYVDVEGKFYPCEKLLERLCIGDIDEGINIKKVFNILKEYESISSNCKFCFARELCEICFVSVVNSKGKLDKEKKEEICKEKKREIAMAFIDYAKIMERNQNALNFLKDYIRV